MATSPEEANKNYNEFKELQKEFKEIKSVPPEKANEVWRNYQLYVEQFYDLLNLNREAREYDFKKNLEAKTKLCEEAEALDKEARCGQCLPSVAGVARTVSRDRTCRQRSA